MSHTKTFCTRFLDKRSDATVKEWGNWLRATQRRVAGKIKSKWLGEEDTGTGSLGVWGWQEQQHSGFSGKKRLKIRDSAISEE